MPPLEKKVGSCLLTGFTVIMRPNLSQHTNTHLLQVSQNNTHHHFFSDNLYNGWLMGTGAGDPSVL